MKTNTIKTLILHNGALIPVPLSIEDILRYNDKKWWGGAIRLSLLEFISKYVNYVDNLLDRYPRIGYDDIGDNTQIGEYNGNLVTAQRDDEWIYVYLNTPKAKSLVACWLFNHALDTFPTIVISDDMFVWSMGEIDKEFLREYGLRLWSKLDSQSSYVPTGDAGVISAEIRNLMEENRFDIASVIADLACQVANLRKDKMMLNYFSRFRDCLRKSICP